MNNGRLAVLSVVICLMVAPALVLAHHAATQYETDKLITLKGTITEFKFVNPHPHLYFEVKDASGNVEMWIAESGAPPSRWYNSGWRANALKFGAQCHAIAPSPRTRSSHRPPIITCLGRVTKSSNDRFMYSTARPRKRW